LRIEIVSLKRGVVDVGLWTFEEEKAVVVNKILSAIEAIEDSNVFAVRVANEL
jgi:hypothetical protein